MNPAIRGDERHRQLRYAILAALGLLALHAAARYALLAVRSPFFDELFTSWISRLPFPDLIAALRLDSGPPLYYAVVHVATGGSIDDARYVSLVAATVIAAILILSRSLGPERWTAALLLAVYPPAVYFGSEARAYALAGAFAGAATIALDRWMRDGRRGDLAVAAATIVLAAHTHYYGVLLAPLPLVLALVERRRERIRQAVAATLLVAAGILPAVWLAAQQPREAMGWVAGAPRLGGIVSALRQIGFAAPYPDGFLPQPSIIVQGISAACILLLAAFSFRSERSRRFGIMWLLPLVLALVLGVLLPVYFPFRFEAVTALAFVLWAATAVSALPRPARTAVVMLLVFCGAAVVYRGVLAHDRGVVDPHREAAQFARMRADAQVPVVVSGLAYLEVLAQRSDAWDPNVVTLPRSQASHPGWRATAAPGELRSEAAALAERMGPEITWIGELGSLEHRAMLERWRVEVLFASEGVAVARARSVRVGE